MKRRLSFATPFVITLACGGSQRDPNEVADPTPMRDIEVPAYDLAPDAAVLPPDAISVDASVVDELQPAQAPLCYAAANPPGYRSCPAYRIVRAQVVDSSVQITFAVGRDHGFRRGMKVVIARGPVATTIDRCDAATCTAMIHATLEHIPRIVFVVTSK